MLERAHERDHVRAPCGALDADDALADRGQHLGGRKTRADARGEAEPLEARCREYGRVAGAGIEPGEAGLDVAAQHGDLEVAVLRGNVETRLARLDAGACDATILAAAGLERLGLAARIRARLSPAEMLPAVGQGIVGVECAAGRADVIALVRPLEHAPSRTALDAERAFAAALGASCQSPIAGHATLEGDTLRLSGLAGSPDGTRILADAVSGPSREAAALGADLAARLLAAGAGDLL